MGINETIKKYNSDPARLMDILLDTQAEENCVTDEAADKIAKELDIARVDVVQARSFYHFFTDKPMAKYTVYLNDSVVANFNGRKETAKAFEEASGVKFNTNDGKIGLYDTSCIGMSDQEPAALINGKVFTDITPDKAKELVKGIKNGKSVDELHGTQYGDGKNKEMKSMVNNNLMKKGDVVFAGYETGQALKKAKEMKPEEVIKRMKDSNLRGRGGAGFPTGMKWELCRNAKEEPKYIFCNADEGEPGTFKDRVILTEMPEQVFEGMAVAGYAAGAKEGILYIRNEYMYMREYLESVLDKMRKGGIIGDDFDIRIQFGAGAYVCGEESALIESAEGKRGEPRDRPPFPVEKGYLEKPTSVNNVETLCAAVKIMIKGPEWFKKIGVEGSPGTKVLSISGDCEKPGVYELPWGVKIKELLDMTGAKNTQAVQVGGPSGTCIAECDFGRSISMTDLSTGGSIIIIGKDRDLLRDVAANFTDFFIEESCGSCVPCRALTVMYKIALEKLLNGKGTKKDIDNMLAWEPYMKKNRCGLGQTAMNPIVSTIKNFGNKYEKLVKAGGEKFNPAFSLEEAVTDYDTRVGNK